MGYGVCLRVCGERACFTRPEMKAERVSYDSITPSAARGVLESIHWKPGIIWIVDRITVLNEIRFASFRRNELSSKASASVAQQTMNGACVTLMQIIEDDRQQRATTMLVDVDYLIDAHFELTRQAGADDSVEKHYNIFLRRARRGQCYQRPYLGCREFPLEFELIEDSRPASYYTGAEKDLGWMLNDLDFGNDMMPHFFRAKMINGIIDVPRYVTDGGGNK